MAAAILARAAHLRRVPPVLSVAIALLILFGAIGVLRYVDGDEGYYLGAAALALDGRVPYVDFFYQQMPLIPYVYGMWAELVGENWYAARLLSAVFATTVGVLMFRHVQRRIRTEAAAVAVTLYATSVLVLLWFPLVKTYALSTLLLFGAYVLVERTRPPTRTEAALAGVLSGLAVDTRLLFAAAVPALAWHVARQAPAAIGLVRRVAPFGGGLTLGLAPSLIFLAVDPGRFVFDNLGAHGVRSSGGLVGDLDQKARAVENLVGIGTPGGATPQFVLLVGAAVAAATVAASQRRIPLALAIAVLLAIASFLPTPTYPQYVCTTVPFLAVAVAELVPREGRFAIAVAAVTALYCLIGAAEVVRTLRMYPDQRIGVVQRVVDIINARTRPGEPVIASWPGYLFGTHAQPPPRLENDFAPRFAAPLDAQQVARYHLATAADVERRIMRGETRLLVVKRWHDLDPLPGWEAAAVRGGYSRVATVASRGRAEVGGPVLIYERAP